MVGVRCRTGHVDLEAQRITDHRNIYFVTLALCRREMTAGGPVGIRRTKVCDGQSEESLCSGGGDVER